MVFELIVGVRAIEVRLYILRIMKHKKQVRISHDKQAVDVRAIEVRLYILRIMKHKKQVRISHDKRAIGVRVNEVRLYTFDTSRKHAYIILTPLNPTFI